jgi:hypothetical protein
MPLSIKYLLNDLKTNFKVQDRILDQFNKSILSFRFEC